mgnify:CR=1 FL=1
MKSSPGQERGNVGGGADGGGGLTLGMAVKAGGAAETVGVLREWEEHLISPHALGTPSLSRDYWRANLASLYNPPSPSDVDVVDLISPAAATPLTPAAAVGCRRSKPGAMLDLEVEHNGSEKQGPGPTESEPLIMTAV